MTILYLANARRQGFGGIQSFLTHLKDACARRHVRSIIATTPREFVHFEEARDWWGRYRTDGVAASHDEAAWLADLLATEQPTVLHSHNTHIPNSPLSAGVIEEVARRAGVPHVLSVHDVTEIPQATQILAELTTTHLATHSVFNRDLLWARIRRQVTVLPIGIPFDRYPPMLEREARTIAVPGRLASHKIPLEMVEALVRTDDARQPWHLLFSTRHGQARGQSEDHIERLVEIVARAGSTCEFLAAGLAPQEIYRRAAATVVMPSHPEGFGLVPLESLACGTPVIAAPTGGMREWLIGLPGAAIVTGPGDPALPGLLRDVADRWSVWSAAARRGREQVRPHFDIEVTAARHLDYYQSLGLTSRAAEPAAAGRTPAAQAGSRDDSSP